MLRLPIFASTCGLLLGASNDAQAAPPDANAIAAITAAAPSVAARPAKARKILVYSRANGFRHSSIETAGQTLSILGQKTGAWSTVVSDDPAVFADLSPYDAVVFANTTGDCLLPGNFKDLDDAAKATAQANEAKYKTNLLNFVNGGKGFVGIHAATDTMYGWADYGQIIGGYFDGHPWGGGDTVTVRVEDDKSPITQALKGQSLTFKEEIYQFRDPYSRNKQRVLMGLDMEKTARKNGMKRSDNDYPVSWIKPQGAGRVFYCSLGHNEALYSNPQVLGVYLAGIQYAIGDLKADTTPLAQMPLQYADAIMGEYVASQDVKKFAKGELPNLMVRIYPEGNGAYRAVGLGLNRAYIANSERVELTGTLQNGTITFTGMDGTAALKGTLTGDELSLTSDASKPLKLRKVARLSPTLGQKAPKNATVLLPYTSSEKTPQQVTSLDAWTNPNWVLMRDGSMQVRGGDTKTKASFGDVKFHVEWLTPLMPEARGQGRGNSGVYLQDRYEVQVLDSFGLDSKDNDAGGIYLSSKPLVNASLPPGQWQTYDITFRAPRLYTDGSVFKPATITVMHNGVLIQKEIPVTHPTVQGDTTPPTAKAPIRLQDHGNAVRYRNIWVQELTDQPWTPTMAPVTAVAPATN